MSVLADQKMSVFLISWWMLMKKITTSLHIILRMILKILLKSASFFQLLRLLCMLNFCIPINLYFCSDDKEEGRKAIKKRLGKSQLVHLYLIPEWSSNNYLLKWRDLKKVVAEGLLPVCMLGCVCVFHAKMVTVPLTKQDLGSWLGISWIISR